MNYDNSKEFGGERPSWSETDFTPCGMKIMRDTPEERVEKMSQAVGVYGAEDDPDPLVTYKYTLSGSVILACWGAASCPGGSVEVCVHDLDIAHLPQTAVALHGRCSTSAC